MANKPHNRDPQPESAPAKGSRAKDSPNEARLGRALRMMRVEKNLSLTEVAAVGGYVGHAYLAAVEGGKQKANTKLIDTYVQACDAGDSIRASMFTLLENPSALLAGQEVMPDEVLDRQSAVLIVKVFVVAARPLELQDERWLTDAANNIRSGRKYTYFLDHVGTWCELYSQFESQLKPKELDKGLKGILVPEPAKPLMFRPFGLCIYANGDCTGFEGRAPIRRNCASGGDTRIESLEVLETEFVVAAHDYLNKISIEVHRHPPGMLQGEAKFEALKPPVDRD